MANTKSNKNNVKEVEKKQQVEVKQEEEINKNVQNEKDQEIENLKQQVEVMQKMLNQFLVMQNVTTTQNSKSEDVVVGCRLLQGVGFSDITIGDISFKFNETQTLSSSDMKIYLRKPNVKKLFEDGLCYFEDEKNYDIFNIRNHVDLSDEKLSQILSGEDINSIIRKLNGITNELRNSNIVNCIIFRICDMIINQKLNLSYYVQKNLEDYFNYEFSRGITVLNMLKNLK